MPEVVFECVGKDEVTVAFQCPFCGNVTNITVPLDEYSNWLHGGHVQNCFKSLGPDERELFITGMCFDCQKELFAQEVFASFDEDECDEN